MTERYTFYPPKAEYVKECWLCRGPEPNETVEVAREYPDGPKCKSYKTRVHQGCWQDMDA